MRFLTQSIFFVLTISLHYVLGQPGDNLNAYECNARLISPRSDTVSVYNGEDLIYIFGGLFFDENHNLIPYDDIHVYNITSDTIQVAVRKLPRTAYGGNAYLDPLTGDILYLRGDGTFLWRFHPDSGITESETEWLGPNAGSTAVLTKDQKVVTFGGLGTTQTIYEFDIATGEQGPLSGGLPRPCELCRGIYTPNNGEEDTFLFAGEMGTWEPEAMSYDHANNVSAIRGASFPSWRHGDGYPVWVRDSIYLVGAVVDNGAIGDGLIRYTPNGEEVAFVPVVGLASLLTTTSAVYVERLNRIYVFGGYDNQNIDRAEIWYVEMP